MTLIEQHQEALLAADRIGAKLEALGRTQYALEKEAFIEVFGEYAIKTRREGIMYNMPNWFQINCKSEIEGWYRGHYGGQDECLWERTIDPRMEDSTQHAAVKADYVAQFTAGKAEEKQAEVIAAAKRRESLLAQVADLNKMLDQ